MRDVKKIKERFIRDPAPVRLGNLASNLLRLSKWVQMNKTDESVIDLIREIAWSMEWTGEMASMEIAEMQREICRWRRAWPIDSDRSLLALRAHQMSHRILELSGLLKTEGKGRDS